MIIVIIIQKVIIENDVKNKMTLLDNNYTKYS